MHPAGDPRYGCRVPGQVGHGEDCRAISVDAITRSSTEAPRFRSTSAFSRTSRRTSSWARPGASSGSSARRSSRRKISSTSSSTNATRCLSSSARPASLLGPARSHPSLAPSDDARLHALPPKFPSAGPGALARRHAQGRAGHLQGNAAREAGDDVLRDAEHGDAHSLQEVHAGRVGARAAPASAAPACATPSIPSPPNRPTRPR